MFHFSSPNGVPSLLAASGSGKQPLTFRHFGRKGYSLFAALGREVKVGVLTVATLSTAAPALAAGAGLSIQTAEATDSIAAPDDVVLGEATVSASRAPMTAAVAARVVMTLSRDDIAAAGVTSINDLFKLCAGVDVRQRGAFGVQTDVSAGGGTFDQITILLNGVNISSPHTGHLSADFPITAQDIERIEVLEGAAARVYGTQAFTGAINIVTRREQREVSVHGYGGMYGYGGGEARVSLPYRHTLHHLSGGYTRSDGATDNSQFSSSRAFAQGQFSTQNVLLDYQVGYSYKPYGANTFYGAASTDQWESNERWMGALRARTDVGRLHMAPTVYWNRWFDHYQWHAGSPAGENFHKVDVYGLSLNNWIDWAARSLSNGGLVQQKTSFGIEMRNEGIRSTKLGELLEESQWTEVGGINGSTHDATANARYKFGANRTNVSGHVEHNVILPHWTFSAGVLANMNTALDTRWRFYPGVDIAWRPTGHWRVYASWNTALRMPTYTDLYYSGTGIEGTRSLKPERTSDVSLKAAYSIPWLTADVAPFFSRKTDMIDWVVRADSPAGTPLEAGAPAVDQKEWVYRSGNFSLSNVGVRANAAWLPQQLWGKRCPLRKVAVQYAYINEDIEYAEPVLASKYAMEYVRHKVVVSADGCLFSLRNSNAHWGGGALNLGLSYRYTDRVTSYSYGLLDARLSWDARHYSVYVDARNILDKTYYDFTYIRQPGIWVIGGVKLRF